MKTKVSLLLAIVCMASIPLPALALQPETVAWLRTLGITPDSQDVAVCRDDRVGKYTLDSLARTHDVAGTRQFIATRSGLRKILKDPTLSPPGDWDIRFLTDDEIVQVTHALGQR